MIVGHKRVTMPPRQVHDSVLLSGKNLYASYMLCLLMFIHHAELFPSKGAGEGSYLEKAQWNEQKEDTTLMTDVDKEIGISAGFTKLHRDKRSGRDNVAWESGLMRLPPENSVVPKRNDRHMICDRSYAFTNQTETLADLNKPLQVFADLKCFEKIETSQPTSRYGPELCVINLSEGNSLYSPDCAECSPGKRVHITGDSGRILLDITLPANVSNKQCNLNLDVLKSKIVFVYFQTVGSSKPGNHLYGYKRDRDNCLALGSIKCPVFSNAINQKQCYSDEKKFAQYTFINSDKNRVQVSLCFETHEHTPKMTVTANSSTSGIEMSPLTNQVSNMPTENVRHNLSVYLEDGVWVMISVQHFDFGNADSFDFCLKITRIEKTPDPLHPTMTNICVGSGTNILVMNASFLVEVLPTLNVHKINGFRLFSSFHKDKEQPARLSSGLFNCSTPTYELLKYHLECNFITECENGEDERNCNYNSQSCTQGIYFKGKCYYYFSFREKMSWMQANDFCWHAGFRLATFQNSSDLDTFANKLLSKQPAFMLWIGLQVSGSHCGTMYKRILRWTNTRSSFDFVTNSPTSTFPSCALLQANRSKVQIKLNMELCNTPITSHVLCEDKSMDPSLETAKTVMFPVVQFQTQNWSYVNASIIMCEDRHFVLDFLSCSPGCHISSLINPLACVTHAGGMMPMFQCDNSDKTLPFTLVCDYNSDCPDNSDESFCHFKECKGFVCNNDKCIAQHLRCNKLDDCDDGSDEIECYEGIIPGRDLLIRVPPLSLIELDGAGSFTYAPRQSNLSCPDTHFKCPGSHCLPVYLHCNGVNDCPGGEDEEYCKKYKNQPGFYRCYQSHILLHIEHLCDGIAQCPQHDDEYYCWLQCPRQCRCQGLAFACSQEIVAKNFPDLRYLDASGTNMTLLDLYYNYYLLSLKLSSCGLTSLQSGQLKNLRDLNLSNNSLSVLNVSFFANFPSLKVLDMSWNPISEILVSKPVIPHLYLSVIRLSGSVLHTFPSLELSYGFPNINVINISDSNIEAIQSFKHLHRLNIIDMNECPVTMFPADVFAGIQHLKRVYTMNYKLCCPAVLPALFHQSDCIAPMDDVSSCDNLLRLPLFRVSLWVFAVVAIVGNGVSFAFRMFFQKKATKAGFPVFVTSLCVADLFMGIYLAIIGVADYIYLGNYLWYDKIWKTSWACRAAGFLSLLSSEVSAFLICFITLDRFIVMRFPFSQRRFQRRSARITSGVVWFIGGIIAVIPLMPSAAYWDFYGQTSICIPLPFTTHMYMGQKYSFGIMIVLNFVLFVVIAAGQVAIFCSVRSNRSKLVFLKGKSYDLVIAHRLALIVLSDFLCWFPIGLLGLLASYNVLIPDEVNVGVAIFVLPFNSALNPFLYTINTLIERRREREKRKLMDFLENRIRSGVQADKARQQSTDHSSVALLSQVMDKVRAGQLSDVEADLVCSMATELVSETKTRNE